MNINQLATKIAKKEGKKHQASIGDIKEILKIICSDAKILMEVFNLRCNLVVKDLRKNNGKRKQKKKVK